MPLSTSDVRRALSAVGAEPSASRPDAYRALQDQIFKSSAPHSLADSIKLYAESILSESLTILQARPMLAALVSAFAACSDAEAKTEAGQHVIQLIAPRVASFEDQDLALKQIVADSFEQQADYRGVATTLQSINMDSAQRPYSPDEKASQWLRIVRCYLEEDEPENAVAYVNRIKGVYPDVKDRNTRVMFLLCQARILDSQRSFLDASAKYYDTSLEMAVDEDDRLRALSQAIVCAILAPAGPLRAVALAKLYKDDRSRQVDEYPIMEKIAFNRLLSPDEAKAFEAKLAPHQKATTADGSTVLEKAILEHNLLAASRLYRNIYTKQLGTLLGTDQRRAEMYAAQMIQQGRLSGYIDQIEGLIFFEGEGSGEKKIAHSDTLVGREQTNRDSNIHSLSERVEAVASLIQERNPVLMRPTPPPYTDRGSPSMRHIWCIDARCSCIKANFTFISIATALGKTVTRQRQANHSGAGLTVNSIIFRTVYVSLLNVLLT